MRAGTPVEVLLTFLKLGLCAFGGPIAHLGYFRAELVERRKWLDDRSYGELVALCQFLPGPASSQVGMMLGLRRAGWLGLLAAWLGFTLPSALIMILLAFAVASHTTLALSGWVHGLKVVAVAVVAQALVGMGKTLCPDRQRLGVAILVATLVCYLPTASGQMLAIVLSGLFGWKALQVPAPNAQSRSYPISRRVGGAALLVYLLLLLCLPLASLLLQSPTLSAIAGVYRAGALVFGGGHVVLPLLQETLVQSGVVTTADFLTGYGAAQALPGPLFAFSAYVGAVGSGAIVGWSGGLLLLVTIFLPAALVVVACVPFWEHLRLRTGISGAIAGINAGVVGILAAALYNPLWISAINDAAAFGLALTCFLLLTVARVSPGLVVLFAAILGQFAWGATGI